MGYHRDFAQCVKAAETHPTRTTNTGLDPASDVINTTPGDDEIGHLLLDRDEFQIRLADSAASHKSNALIYRMYSRRGYKLSTSATVHEANEITLQGCRDSTVFGTLTLRFDSGRGLGADALYRDEIEDYRRAGAKVAELTRLAVDPEFGSKELLGALFHLAYVFAGPVRKTDDVFIEVNPRHVPFYRRMLEFRVAGECKLCPRVDAPAILMHVKVAHVGMQAARCGGRASATSRSLYPYFCSPREEADVTRRIFELSGSKDAVMPQQAGRSGRATASRITHGDVECTAGSA